MMVDVDRSNSFEGRIVIVTGGGTGIGRAYAKHFADQDAIPVIDEINGQAGVNVEYIGRTEQSLTRVFKMQKIKRIEQTGDLVGMGLFLASPASNFMTGQSVIVDESMTYS